MKNIVVLLCLFLTSSTLFAEGKVSLRVSHISHRVGGIPVYYSDVLEFKVYGVVQGDPHVKGLAKLPGVIVLSTHKREKHKLIADCAKKAEDSQRAKKIFVVDLFMDNPSALAKKIGHATNPGDFRRVSEAFDLSLEDSDFKRIECSSTLK